MTYQDQIVKLLESNCFGELTMTPYMSWKLTLTFNDVANMGQFSNLDHNLIFLQILTLALIP